MDTNLLKNPYGFCLIPTWQPQKKYPEFAALEQGEEARYPAWSNTFTGVNSADKKSLFTQGCLIVIMAGISLEGEKLLIYIQKDVRKYTGVTVSVLLPLKGKSDRYPLSPREGRNCRS